MLYLSIYVVIDTAFHHQYIERSLFTQSINRVCMTENWVFINWMSALYRVSVRCVYAHNAHRGNLWIVCFVCVGVFNTITDTPCRLLWHPAPAALPPPHIPHSPFFPRIYHHHGEFELQSVQSTSNICEPFVLYVSTYLLSIITQRRHDSSQLSLYLRSW